MKKLILVSMILLGAALAQAADVLQLKAAASSERQPDQFLSYNFGRIFVQQTAYANFTLTAHMNQDAVIQEIQMVGQAFSARTNCPAVLPAGRTCTIQVRFWPMFDRPYRGDMRVRLETHTIHVGLYGSATRRF